MQNRIVVSIWRIFQYVLQIIIFLILPFAVFTFITSKTPMLGTIQSMVVLSGSMEPTLTTGSVVYIKKELGYDNGDVITFKNDAGQNVTHRIIDIAFTEAGTTYRTQGDANTSADTQIIPSAKVSGKVFLAIPVLGKFIAYLNSPQGFFLSIIIPSLFFIAIELWNIKKEFEKQIEKRILERMHIS